MQIISAVLISLKANEESGPQKLAAQSNTAVIVGNNYCYNNIIYIIIIIVLGFKDIGILF